METNELTLENFKEKTGKRFRCSREQTLKIKNGEMTREQAFQEWLASQKLVGENS